MTRRAVASLTSSRVSALSALEAVAGCTPARLATSLSVTTGSGIGQLPRVPGRGLFHQPVTRIVTPWAAARPVRPCEHADRQRHLDHAVHRPRRPATADRAGHAGR